MTAAGTAAGAGNYATLPLNVVMDAVQRQPGICTQELQQLELAAPKRIKLAVPVLTENAAIKLSSTEAQTYPTA